MSHEPVPTFQRSGRRERLYLAAGHGLPGRAIDVPDRDAALALLRDLARDPWGRGALRQVYADAVGRASVCGESDQAVLEGLSRRLVTGAIRAHSVDLPPAQVPPGSLLPVPEAEPVKPAEKPAEPTWVEVEVRFADSGHPVAGIELTVKPPGGSAAPHTTNGDGLIRIDGIKLSGDCEIKSAIKGVTRAAALSVGGAPPAAPVGPEPAHASYKLVNLTHYKVKTGDSLDSLSKKVGITWKDLAKFNWATDDPKEINKHLRWDVGCTKKSGSNYLFDDTDDPGIILLPEPVELSVSTGTRLSLGVELLTKSQPWIFSL